MLSFFFPLECCRYTT